MLTIRIEKSHGKVSQTVGDLFWVLPNLTSTHISERNIFMADVQQLVIKAYLGQVFANYITNAHKLLR